MSEYDQWVTCWTASAQGPYPIGNPSAQPDLSGTFPAQEIGAQNQGFRLIIRPDVWGARARFRFSNVFGTCPLTLDGVYVGLQLSGSALVPESNRPVSFAGEKKVTIAPGEALWSDAVATPLGGDLQTTAGRKMAVSFHVAGTSGPMTWHAKALTSSYLTRPNAGTRAVVCLGDSIVDGTGSTLNGDDRWPDVMSRRVHAMFGQTISVVNAGIGGNQVIGPKDYSAARPFAGGPSALSRLERDVLSLSNVGAVIWLEGGNDFSDNGRAQVAAVIAGMRDGVGRMRSGIPGVRIIGATVGSALGSSNPSFAHPDQDKKRQALNAFIRTSDLFDAVVDFDLVITDPQSGRMRAEFVPDSTCGGSGDGLHPNRLGYQAMGAAVDLDLLRPKDLVSAHRLRNARHGLKGGTETRPMHSGSSSRRLPAALPRPRTISATASQAPRAALHTRR